MIMSKPTMLFLLMFLMANVCAQQSSELIVPGAKPELLSEGYTFTEGPAVDREGNVYFTDLPNNRIMKWSITNELTTFTTNSGRANGLYFDMDDRMVACSDMDNQLWRFTKDGNYEILVTDYDGKLLNGPNDVWVHPSGLIYFTDPMYKRDYWTRDPEIQQDGEHVYLFNPKTKTLKKIIDDLEKPNGLVGTLDGKTLYIADIKANKTYAYTVEADGSLTNKRLFTSLGSDGMTIDEKGNIYLTGNGVTIFNPDGEQIEHIPIDSRWTSNVCFGGADMKTLFITATHYFFRLPMQVKGVK